MRVDQILCAAGPVDAVTNQALAYRELIRTWGFTGEDFAPVQAAGMARGAVRPLHQLRPRDSGLVVMHYSGYAPGLEEILAACPRSLLVSHNITPAGYFWITDPVEAVRCELARGQLARLAALAGGLAAVSEYNARELTELSGREVGVIPILFDRRRLPPRSPVAPAPVALFVGRLVPHKRQDLLIRAVGRWRRAEPAARLVLVGTPSTADVTAGLKRLAGELAPGAVSVRSGLTSAALWDVYQQAGAFLCLSEHEGFCIPLLEAFHFGLPVIARDAGAVGEVIADAGVLLDAGDGVGVVAELLQTVLDDRELRAELVQRGDRRLDAYAYDRTAAMLRAKLREVTG